MKYWLTFNEINSGMQQMGNILSTSTVKGYSGTLFDFPDDPQTRFQAMHHQFVASAKVVLYAHEHYPDFKMGNMVCCIVSYPYTCKPEDILEAQHQMQYMNWYCSDVQCKGEYPFYAKRICKENGVSLHMEPGDLVCYSGHVAMYIGGGRIVHASSRKEGIKVSNDPAYRTIVSIRRPWQ